MNETVKIIIPANFFTAGLIIGARQCSDYPLFSEPTDSTDDVVMLVPAFLRGSVVDWLAIMISASARPPEIRGDYNAGYSPDMPVPNQSRNVVTSRGAIGSSRYLSLHMENPYRPAEEQWVIFTKDSQGNHTFYGFAESYLTDNAE